MTELQFIRRFGINLQDMLDETYMSQSELSEETGISKSTISRYTAGEVMPTLKNIINIMVALDCKFEDLVDMPDNYL